MFKAFAIDRANVADAAFSAALAATKLDRWESPRAAWPQAVEAAYLAKTRADDILNLAFAIDRAEQSDIGHLLNRDDDFVIQCLITSGARLSNIEVLNALAGFNLALWQWEVVFGGNAACGQGAIPDSIWHRVKTIRHLAESARACLA